MTQGFAKKPTATDFYVQVAQGLITGHKSVFVTGRSDNIGINFVDLWEPSGSLDFPTVAESWELLSDNANDTSAGTGLRAAQIVTMDDDFIEKTSVVVLNGTTPVALTGTHYRVQSIVGVSTGTGEVNEGTITLRQVTTNKVRGVMTPGTGASRSSIYTIPAGKTGYAFNYHTFFAKDFDGEFRAILRIENGSRISRTNIPIYQSPTAIKLDSANGLPEKSDIIIQAKSANVDATVTVIYEILLVDN